jgi:MFS family permease
MEIPGELWAAARRITAVLFGAMGVGSAAFIAMATVSTIAGADLSGGATWAGLPTMVLLVGSAASAPLWGKAMDMIGRRWSLVISFGVGILGAGGSLVGLQIRSLVLFLIGAALLGGSQSAGQLSRFAAGEVNVPEARGRAISTVVLGGTFGAVFGPMLVAPAGTVMLSFGVAEIGGPYAAGALLLAAGGLLVALYLRPDPKDLGKKIAELLPASNVRISAARRTLREILAQQGALVAILSMVVGQMVMVMLMVITSLHMKDHHHGLADISVVISSHTLGMYAFSILSGRLSDHWGRERVIAAGAILLVAASVTAPLSPEVLPIAVALFLLGLGWNFCYVGGSSLLADQLHPEERATVQGFNDLLVGLASAVGSLASGLVFSAAGYGAMGALCALAALILLGLGSWRLLTLRPMVPAS